jgi:hypothetical protein
VRRVLRPAALAALLLAAAPAFAYFLPPGAVLRRLAQRREQLALSSLEVKGTLQASGEAARALAAAAGLPPAGPGGDVSVPALLSIKAPGRCRLELAPPAAGADRPFVAIGRGRLVGGRGLDRVPAAVALLRATCALLGQRASGPDPGRAYADELARLGVSLEEQSLGRLGARVAYVIGAPSREKRPQAWVDKQSYQPVRLIAAFAGPLGDVRLVDYGSAVGGDLFPRAVEVHEEGALSARLVAEKVAPNPKIADGLFP